MAAWSEKGRSIIPISANTGATSAGYSDTNELARKTESSPRTRRMGQLGTMRYLHRRKSAMQTLKLAADASYSVASSSGVPKPAGTPSACTNADAMLGRPFARKSEQTRRWAVRFGLVRFVGNERDAKLVGRTSW